MPDSHAVFPYPTGFPFKTVAEAEEQRARFLHLQGVLGELDGLVEDTLVLGQHTDLTLEVRVQGVACEPGHAEGIEGWWGLVEGKAKQKRLIRRGCFVALTHTQDGKGLQTCLGIARARQLLHYNPADPASSMRLLDIEEAADLPPQPKVGRERRQARGSYALSWVHEFRPWSGGWLGPLYCAV